MIPDCIDLLCNAISVQRNTTCQSMRISQYECESVKRLIDWVYHTPGASAASLLSWKMHNSSLSAASTASHSCSSSKLESLKYPEPWLDELLPQAGGSSSSSRRQFATFNICLQYFLRS